MPSLIYPGEIELTLIFFLPKSNASAFVKDIIAPFELTYPGLFGNA
jgi:hypothetical protein